MGSTDPTLHPNASLLLVYQSLASGHVMTAEVHNFMDLHVMVDTGSAVKTCSKGQEHVIFKRK